MVDASLQVAAFNPAVHDRSPFTCGTAALDRYLREQVAQDIRRRVAACFVALSSQSQVIGYYTLAAASVPLVDLPAGLRHKLPRYPAVPAIRMGRLAVDLQFKGQGLGGVLLVDAMRRSARSEVPAAALIVEAKDEQAAAFYRHHGFMTLADSPLNLFLPLACI